MNASDRFEINADLYHRRFGQLAPGKNEAAAMHLDSMSPDNREQYDTWMASGLAWKDALERISFLQDRLAGFDSLILNLNQPPLIP